LLLDSFTAWGKTVGEGLWWFLCAWIPLQLVLLKMRGVTLLPFWYFIDLQQLYAYVPLFNYIYMPPLYHLIKPHLLSHAVFNERPFVFLWLADTYPIHQWRKYGMSMGNFGQIFYSIILFAGVLVILNILCFIGSLVFPKKCG
jgi:hypothetical protein